MSHIRELEHFGVGKFSSSEVAEKTAFVRQLMEKRARPDHPHISVVIPAHREQQYILATLRSLSEQTYQDSEFIIVSNGELAGNPTQRICEAAGFKVIHDPVGGISRARQTGLEAARGDIIVTTDADTLHDPKWLERIKEIMRNENIACGAGVRYSLSKKISVRAVQAVFSWIMRAENAINPRFVTGVSEANSFYRRSLALASGGYDPATRIGEGIVLFKNFRKPGVPLIFADKELVVYTSGRRIEQEGILRFVRIVMHNTALQIFGKKGLSTDEYPDIR